MICDHPQCTGKHSTVFPVAERCPAATSRINEKRRDRYANDPEYRDRVKKCSRENADRERARIRSIEWRQVPLNQARHRLWLHVPEYVYAILINESILKIGYSTLVYSEQVRHVEVACRKRGFDTPATSEMIWRNRGDKWLETFLQLYAHRMWSPLTTKGTRLSEWFNVTDVGIDMIIKYLRLWRDQAEYPIEENDELESTPLCTGLRYLDPR